MMTTKPVTLLLFCVAIGCAVGQSILQPLKFSEERIIGGQLARPGQFPYQVALVLFSQASNETSISTPFCGGIIISERWILTAAHCTQGRMSQPANIRILVGATNIITDGELKTVDRIVNHPGYTGNGGNLANDLSVIQLAEPIEFDEEVRSIALKDRTIDGGTRSTVSGWGLTERNTTAADLKFIQLYTMDTDECREVLEGFEDYIHSSTICASQVPGIGVCNGDSGGPLTAGNRLIGIVSWTIVPCGQNLPSGFTRVSSFLDWIEETTGVVPL